MLIQVINTCYTAGLCNLTFAVQSNLECDYQPSKNIKILNEAPAFIVAALEFLIALI